MKIVTDSPDAETPSFSNPRSGDTRHAIGQGRQHLGEDLSGRDTRGRRTQTVVIEQEQDATIFGDRPVTECR